MNTACRGGSGHAPAMLGGPGDRGLVRYHRDHARVQLRGAPSPGSGSLDDVFVAREPGMLL